MTTEFKDIPALRMLFKAGIQISDLEISVALANTIKLTEKGSASLEIVGSAMSDLKEQELRFVIFMLPDAEETLVSPTTDLSEIEQLLHEAVLQRKIIFPYTYQRVLYDNAFSLFDHPNQISGDKLLKLFDGVPRGVAQFGIYVVGELGLRKSKANREIFTEATIPLWHCKNVSCSRFHETTLNAPNVQIKRWIRRAIQALGHSTSKEESPQYIAPQSYYDDYWPSDLVALLGNGFAGEEILSIARCVQELHGKSIRKFEINRNDFETCLLGNKDTLSSVAAGIQYCLLIEDHDLIACIDSMVLNHQLHIPESEIRSSVVEPPPRSWQRVYCQCSNLGVRIKAAHSSMVPLARLRRLILELYDGEKRDDLVWILRKNSGASVGEKLENYIQTQEPLEVLQRLVLNSPSALKAALKHIRAPHLRVPEGESEEKQLLQIICWKLGFARKRFGSSAEGLRSRVTAFRQIAAAEFQDEEEWKEQVRSVGVNLFVSVEEVLDSALAFAVWLLLTDHIEEKHLFNIRKARILAEKEISGIISTDKGPVDYKANGKNTLFPLITGFDALHKRIEQLLEQGSEIYEKPKAHLPFWSMRSKLQIMPFRHRHFVFDLDLEDRKRILALIKKTSNRLLNSNVLTVRNNVPHVSELFPDRNQIRECCQVLEETLNELESFGLIPMLYAALRVETDSWQHRRVHASDYKGRTVVWTVSAAASCLHDLPGYTEPQIIVPGLKLSGTAEPVRLGLQEDSPFTKLWESYPKRKIPEASRRLEEIRVVQ